MAPTVHQIVTHPGSAHKDDFLACCVLIHLHRVPVRRREPSDEDLDDPGTLVVDVGHRHEPARGNFDHHQFPGDHPPVCALSLVLQHQGLYEDARSFCDWLEPAEWLDARGPRETAEWLGIDRDIIGKLVSPVDVTLLRRFAASRELTDHSPLWQIMGMVGEDLIDYLRDLRGRLEYLHRHAEFWVLEKGGETGEVLFVPRTDPVPEEPSSGLGRYIEAQGRSGSVIAMVYPDRRGRGYGLTRHNDDPRMDFTGLEERFPEVHFAHARGFVAKTSATDPDRLKEMLLAAFRGGTGRDPEAVR